jgi:hypothetical protein
MSRDERGILEVVVDSEVTLWVGVLDPTRSMCNQHLTKYEKGRDMSCLIETLVPPAGDKSIVNGKRAPVGQWIDEKGRSTPR